MAGKRAIVTGAGSEHDEIGIGRAIAIALASEGAMVGCVDLALDRAEATCAHIRDLGGQAVAIAGDVGRTDECSRIVDVTADAFGGIDTLINNVGISVPTRLANLDEAQWDRIYSVNLKSALMMSRFVVPHMIAARGGSITNISSIAGIRAHGSLAYGTSKAAMAQLSREIAALHGRDGIRANTVAPGHVMTPHVARMLPPDMREARRKIGPLGIEGGAWDIAMAVLYLASDEARFVTAVELAVDGGVTQTGPLFAHGLIAREDGITAQ